jgi:hypothetical protein
LSLKAKSREAIDGITRIDHARAAPRGAVLIVVWSGVSDALAEDPIAGLIVPLGLEPARRSVSPVTQPALFSTRPRKG